MSAQLWILQHKKIDSIISHLSSEKILLDTIQMQLAQQKPQVEIALFKLICVIDEKKKKKNLMRV